MKLNRRIAMTVTGVTTLVGATVALAPAAGATGTTTATTKTAVTASAPATKAASAAAAAAYNGACGTGYRVVNSAQIGTPKSLGTVYLTYSAATGKNCVVTVRNAAGSAVHMTAELTITATGERSRDSGNYTTYAGPVYLHAAGYCVNWYGEISGISAGKVGTNCSSAAR
ncbi:spore-associated protein A [Streptomyces sp. NBC_00344]|uniref:spore-associated protein A n=1 Tax=Streptomyces sp. NBC_00344 TaxID=2975720 RepID=UPI002E231B19